MQGNEAKDQQLITLLQQLQPGFVPYDIFVQLARIVALPIFEVVPLRAHNGRIEVLLLPRDKDDPIWPSQIHTPGTVVRATDVGDQAGILQRIVTDELNGTNIGELHFVCNMLHQSKRGAEQAQVYWAEVSEEPKSGTFYDVDNLPENVIDSQREFIAQAVEKYKEQL